MEIAYESVNLPLQSGRMRASRRFDYRVDVALRTAGSDRTIVLESADVSQDGLFVEAPILLDEGTPVACTFARPDGSNFEAAGQIVRIESGDRTRSGSGMGIEFVDIEPIDRLRLRGALARA